MRDIKFGTDGWRAVIGEAFTFENVKIVSQAISDYLNKKKKRTRPVVAVGYDTRFLSDRFAETVCEVLAGNGIKTILSEEPVSTPALSFAVQKGKLSAGIMITASHNPARFSGIKFKAEYGGPADQGVTEAIERNLGRGKIKRMNRAEAEKKALITQADMKRPYFRIIRSYLKWKVIKKAKFNILVDSMFGAGSNYFEELLSGTKCRVVTIRNIPNPGFGGINPEPIAKNLKETAKAIKSGKYDIGIATDGDADRIGALEPDSAFINAHRIFALMLIHLLEDRGWKGEVAKTISTTSLINRIAEKHNLKVHETPVGFKHIARLLLRGNLLIGGEESGGFGFKDYLLERDGVMSGFLLLEMMAMRKKGISRLLREMDREYGRFYFLREDLEYPDHMKKILVKKLLKKPLKALAGKKIKEIQSGDGIKFVAEDDSWILMRLSGTEPIMRIYTEAPSKKRVKAIMTQGKRAAFSVDKI